MSEEGIKLAILDMNNGEPNQGLRCIREIVEKYNDKLSWKIFDVRQYNELPDLSYDIFISSGGPGNPNEGGEWKDRFFELIDGAWKYNLAGNPRKKHFFFICHSFQMACEHFDLAEITQRNKTAFGVYPVHKTEAGKSDIILEGLADPYYAIDSRDWQLIQPRLEVFEEHGAQILSLEKIRDHVDYERAIMSVRFSREFVGTQFHPEADPLSLKEHLKQQENRDKIITNFGQTKYEDMLEHLDDPDKINLTYQTILPGFINRALNRLNKENLVVC